MTENKTVTTVNEQKKKCLECDKEPVVFTAGLFKCGMFCKPKKTGEQV